MIELIHDDRVGKLEFDSMRAHGGHQAVGVVALYKLFASSGIEYGYNFRTLAHAWAQETQAVALLQRRADRQATKNIRRT